MTPTKKGRSDAVAGLKPRTRPRTIADGRGRSNSAPVCSESRDSALVTLAGQKHGQVKEERRPQAGDEIEDSRVP